MLQHGWLSIAVVIPDSRLLIPFCFRCVPRAPAPAAHPWDWGVVNQHIGVHSKSSGSGSPRKPWPSGRMANSAVFGFGGCGWLWGTATHRCVVASAVLLGRPWSPVSAATPLVLFLQASPKPGILARAPAAWSGLCGGLSGIAVGTPGPVSPLLGSAHRAGLALCQFCEGPQSFFEVLSLRPDPALDGQPAAAAPCHCAMGPPAPGAMCRLSGAPTPTERAPCECWSVA